MTSLASDYGARARNVLASCMVTGGLLFGACGGGAHEGTSGAAGAGAAGLGSALGGAGASAAGTSGGAGLPQAAGMGGGAGNQEPAGMGGGAGSEAGGAAAGVSGSASGSGGVGGETGTGGAGTGGAEPQAGAFGSGGTAGGAGGEAAGGTAQSGSAGMEPASGGGAMGGAGGSMGGAGGSMGGSGGAGYEPCPPMGACVIMPFGDSITEGYPNGGGYRVELFRLAHSEGHDITFVGSATPNGPNMVDGVPFPRNHEGHGGYTIDSIGNANGIRQFVEPSIQNYEPDIITLMIGTNDINGNLQVASAPERLGQLLDAIYAADADVLVILAQIVPTRSDGTNQAVQTYNAAIPALVTERTAMGYHLILIDMYEAFARDADYKTTLLGDNLHPNDTGYARMGQTWYDTLSQYLN